MTSRQQVSMAEIATGIGCSSSDVALVLAADPRVSSELRRKISEAIEESGYQLLQVVQGRLGRPLKLAIVLKTNHRDNPQENRFYLPIASAIALSCTNHGAEMVEATMSVDNQYELRDVPAVLLDGTCDGAFLVGIQFDADHAEQIRAAGCPVVLADGYSASGAFDSVVTDNAAGARVAVEHLISAGHRDIAMLGTEPNCYPSMLDRRIGYQDAIAAAGLRPHFIDSEYTLARAAAVVGVDYFAKHPEVTALFGCNDFIAATFMETARDAGYRLPADISLVGFDDIDLARLVMPALTTMAIDQALMGRAAFALLAHRLEVPEAKPIEAVVVPHLVERESVVPPRDQPRP